METFRTDHFDLGKKFPNLETSYLGTVLVLNQNMKFVHVAARYFAGLSILKPLEARFDLWRDLRTNLTPPLAGILMPNHLHLIYPEDEYHQHNQKELALALRRNTLRFETQPHRGWRVSDPDRIADWKHLKRTLRYVHLNPCRSNLTPHPYLWVCSTIRDDLGLTLKPWSSLQTGLKNCQLSLHQYLGYLTSDDQIREKVSEPKKLPPVTTLYTPHEIKRAMMETQYFYTDQLSNLNADQRKVYVNTAKTAGWERSQDLADHLCISRQRVNRIILLPKPTSAPTLLRIMGWHRIITERPLL